MHIVLCTLCVSVIVMVVGLDRGLGNKCQEWFVLSKVDVK